MSWIPKKPTTASAFVPSATAAAPAALTLAKPRLQGFSLEMPVVMSVRRLPAPVYGTLMEVNANGARIRSLVLMERGTEVEFDLSLAGNAPITVNGRVEGRRNASSGARFEYLLSFETMAEPQVDALARAVGDLDRRAAATRSIQRSLDAIPTTDRERRGSYRALTAFPVHFRREGDEWNEGKVGDISATGIRLTCAELIAIGTVLDMRLTLPASVLDVYPEETAVLDISQGVPRRVGGRADMRRPFEEMRLRGRVVTRFQPVREREVYGVAFIEIDGYQREEIARFTHAVQLSKIRSK
ncbi:MAG TPA: PilZ domain-containing protein [Candidatus Baltobacteraceae bacterium]|nr:PilZ domain-containing protein [Candidatus Baltobacteraceae bacterium]